MPPGPAHGLGLQQGTSPTTPMGTTHIQSTARQRGSVGSLANLGPEKPIPHSVPAPLTPTPRPPRYLGAHSRRVFCIATSGGMKTNRRLQCHTPSWQICFSLLNCFQVPGCFIIPTEQSLNSFLAESFPPSLACSLLTGRKSQAEVGGTESEGGGCESKEEQLNQTACTTEPVN